MTPSGCVLTVFYSNATRGPPAAKSVLPLTEQTNGQIPALYIFIERGYKGRVEAEVTHVLMLLDGLISLRYFLYFALNVWPLFSWQMTFNLNKSQLRQVHF